MRLFLFSLAHHCRVALQNKNVTLGQRDGASSSNHPVNEMEMVCTSMPIYIQPNDDIMDERKTVVVSFGERERSINLFLSY
jgi:hypothetical protein